MKQLFLIPIALLLAVSPAQANFFKDAGDALTGHVSDLKDRITHDDAFVEGKKIGKGKFRTDDPGQDVLHWAEGKFYIVQQNDRYYLQLGKTFDAGFAPDLYIYTSSTRIEDEDDFAEAEHLAEIAKLDSGSGAQYYELDMGIPGIEQMKHVTIWCKQFGQFMGSGKIKVKK